MPKKRQSTAETLSVEQKAFLHPAGDRLSRTTKHDSVAETADRRVSTFPTAGKSRREPTEQTRHSPAPVLCRRGQVLQSVSLRLRPEVARALRKAAAHRSVDYEEPFTQQGIAEQAIARWLEDRGFGLE